MLPSLMFGDVPTKFSPVSVKIVVLVLFTTHTESAMVKDERTRKKRVKVVVVTVVDDKGVIKNCKPRKTTLALTHGPSRASDESINVI